jgi:hypothetical protein
MELDQLYVVEWSERQNVFHVHQVEAMLRKNLQCYLHQRDADHSDWMVLALTESYDKAQDIVQRLKESLDLPPEA